MNTMATLTMPMPSALRMRSLFPLIEENGSCTLIYDLERAAVLDVPEEWQGYVAPALETGDPDEALFSWMLAEDLLTADGGFVYEEVEAPLLMTSWWSPGLVLRRGNEIHARLDNARLESALQTLEFIFKQSLGAERVILRLSWGGAFPPTRTLAGIVVEANRQAALARQEVRYELSLDAWVVTPAVAAFLADFPFHVRLHCGNFPASEAGWPARDAHAWQLAENGLRLLSGLADRLTVQCVLDGPARLRDLWVWAKAMDVRHLDPVRLEDSDPLNAHLRQYRSDLLAVSAEVCADLGSLRPSIDCQPLSRVVNKLMRSESFACPASPPAARPGGTGDVYPSPGDDAEPPFLADLGYGLERCESEETVAAGAPAEGDGGPCAGCWARYLCSHSALPSSPINASADRREPTEERCAFWLAEVEAGLRFYHRLALADPLETVRLFDDPGVAIDLLDRQSPLEAVKLPF